MRPDRDTGPFPHRGGGHRGAATPQYRPIYEIGQHDGRPYFTLEYLDGGALASRLRDGPLPAANSGQHHRQLAEGLAYAHDKGIIHRDIKPANVLFAADGTPKITDFGLAKNVAADTEQTMIPG